MDHHHGQGIDEAATAVENYRLITSRGINLNYSAGHGLTLYGNLRNVLNQYYEEAFGFPALKLNFVAGMKWSLARAR